MATKSTYATLKAKIAELEAQAQDALLQEKAVVIAEVQAKVAEFGLTVEDIFGRKHGDAVRAKKGTLAPKYRDPKTGATWTGRGRAPTWIRDVSNRNRFLIKE